MDRGKELAEGSSPGADPATGVVTPSRYELQKRLDWNTFGLFLRNPRPPSSLPQCNSNQVLDFDIPKFGFLEDHLEVCKNAEFDHEVDGDSSLIPKFGFLEDHLEVCKNAEFDHEVDGDSSQYQKRAVSTEYSSIHSSIDQFLEKNINTIGDDQVKLVQYGMPRLRAFITLKFFQMAEESGLMLVMDSSNTSNMLNHFEEPLLRDCIQEIQNQGPIQEIQKPESHEEEKLDRIMKISLDGAKQGAAVVVGYVLSSSSSKSGVVLYVIIFALFMGISFSMLAHLLRNKYESVSKVLIKLGIMGTASSVILSFAALIPKVILSCAFGTIAILLLAFMLMMN